MRANTPRFAGYESRIRHYEAPIRNIPGQAGDLRVVAGRARVSKVGCSPAEAGPTIRYQAIDTSVISTAAMRLPSSAPCLKDSIWSKFM